MNKPVMTLEPMWDSRTNVPMSGSWYRGDVRNFRPAPSELIGQPGIDNVVEGWVPDMPFIATETKVTALGSCFATEIIQGLGQRGIAVNDAFGDDDLLFSHMVRVSAGMENTFAMRRHVEFALAGARLQKKLWVDRQGNAIDVSQKTRKSVQRLYRDSDVFIFTLGLAEIWEDKKYGPLWRAIPKKLYDPEQHFFRLSTVEENCDNLVAMAELILQEKPQAQVIFTLSPVPMLATFRQSSCVVANEVSKAILRVAIDQALERLGPAVAYWPSYEIVKNCFQNPYQPDGRHIEKTVVEQVIEAFCRYWCK